jgi:uncharacterized protein (UPF0332 family)
MSDTTKIRIQQAEESLEEASVINDFDVSNLAILTKLYHAMIYALMAIFEISDIGNLTHADLIERFERDYVLKGLVTKEFLDALRFAYDFTHECDCAQMKEPEERDIAYLKPLAEGFVRLVSTQLS